MLGRLAQDVRAGAPRALARALTLIERQDAQAAQLLVMLLQDAPVAPVIGFTGSPGVGKSSLLSSCLSAWRAAGRTVAVAAVDPSSPVSGGAILGDRLRMHLHATDAGVFIRSVSSRGSVGGLAESVFGVTTAMQAAGWDIVVIETVGTGQAEIDIVDLADVTAVITAPGLGDDVQALKAGILEIADVLVVNKADLPGADVAANQLRGAVALRDRVATPVVLASATTGNGVGDVVDALDGAFRARSERDPARRAAARVGRVLMQRCARDLRLALLQEQAELERMADRVVRGGVSLPVAAARLLSLIATRTVGDAADPSGL